MQNALIFFKWCIKKKKVYQQFDVDIVPPAWNFIKNETPAQVFPCESFGVFDSAALLIRDSQKIVFLQILENFKNT